MVLVCFFEPSDCTLSSSATGLWSCFLVDLVNEPERREIAWPMIYGWLSNAQAAAIRRKDEILLPQIIWFKFCSGELM